MIREVNAFLRRELYKKIILREVKAEKSGKGIIRKKRGTWKDYTYGLHLLTTKSNTFVTLIDKNGLVLKKYSGGMLPLKVKGKSTEYAASMLGSKLGSDVSRLCRNKKGVQSIGVMVKNGTDSRVESLLKSFIKSSNNCEIKLYIVGIYQGHNGVRLKKKKRL